MFQLFIYTSITLIAFTFSSELCYTMKEEECNKHFLCYFEEKPNVCLKVNYSPLGLTRPQVPQYMIFHNDETCNFKIEEGNDFVATETFSKSLVFSSWCRMMNISKIRIYKDSDITNALDGSAESVIIFPKAQDGCILLYSESFFRGKSWEVCRPVKLEGEKIRSVMIGRRAQVSLYDSKGGHLYKFQQLTYNINGLQNLKTHHFEYILVEKYDD